MKNLPSSHGERILKFAIVDYKDHTEDNRHYVTSLQDLTNEAYAISYLN